MPVQEPVDMSAAWLSHAPPPPPSTAIRKPRRSSSYEPLAAQKGSIMNDKSTLGGYLPPSSHSPEPPRSRRNSVAEAKDVPASTSTPSSPIKRVRSKVTSNPAPPAASSALYNYQHQLQQQKQQLYRQQPAAQATAYDATYAHAPPAPHSSVAMAYSNSESASSPAYSGYIRDRRDSAPAVSYSAAQPPQTFGYSSQPPPVHQSAYAPVAGPSVSMPMYPQSQAPVQYAQPNVVPASHFQHMPSYQNQVTANPQYGALPQQQYQQWPPAPQSSPFPQQNAHSTYYGGVAAPPTPQPQPPIQQQQPQPWEQPSYGMTSPPPQAPVSFPISHVAAPIAAPSHTHAFPPMNISSPPMPTSDSPNGVPISHQAYSTDLSRQSTTSSVGSVRRPLPQPSRTSSNPSAPGSPVTGAVGLTNRNSVRRDLPRPPAGSPATISAGSPLAKGDSGSPGSPSAGTTSRLPPTALNRTESVRLAAEALMARGAPQRRPLRSALASTTFSPPMPATRMAGSPLTQAHELPVSHSEPVANGHGSPAQVVVQQPPAADPRTSQSAGSALSHSSDSNYARSPERTAPSAPARFQDAYQQTAQPNETQQYAPPPTQHSEPARYQNTTQLVDAMAGMSVTHGSPATSQPPSIPVFSFDAPDEEPEKPRRRRGSSVSRAAPAPGQKFISQSSSPVAVPSIVLPGDDDDDAPAGPSISVLGPDTSGPTISITTDDDDARSQTSTGSRNGPSISVSFSAEPSAKSQRAGTSQSPNSPYSRSGAEDSRVSASSVGSGAGCQGCRKWIAGKVVHALGTTFHPSCFVCAHCSEGLEHVAFYEHDGLPYCHFDYHELFSKRCFHCRTPIVDERYITVADEELTGSDGETKERCYHELHFFCANCGDPFLDPKAAGSVAGGDPGLMMADESGRVKAGGMEFVVHKGYAYCEKCHVNLHKERCRGCKRPILGDLISALGGKWHPECFTCELCREPFQDTQFFVKEGKPYDEECYKVLLRNMI